MRQEAIGFGLTSHLKLAAPKDEEEVWMTSL
jgi:hypothetical protein